MKFLFAPKRFLTSLLILAFVGLTINSLTYSGGPPAGLTNAPGEAACTQCHNSFALDSTSSNLNNLSLSGNFTGGGYIPDSTYTMTLSYSESGVSRFGFELTCLNSSHAMAGSFTKTSNATNKVTTTIYGGTREYMQQSSSGNSGSGTISWTFSWTAPSTNVDTVYYYVVVNASNSNSGTSGDRIRFKKFKILPSTLLPVATATADTNVICSNSNLQFYGNSSDTTSTYSWSFPFGNPSSSTAQNPVVTYSIPGAKNAILTVTNNKGVSKPDTVSITVKQNATAFISGGNRTFCEGDSVQLVASFDPNSTYLWNTGATGNILWAKDTGEYQVTVTKNGCERSSNIIKCFFYAKPVTSLTSDASSNGDTSCADNVIMLEASAGFDSFYYYANGVEIGRSDTNFFATTFMEETTYGVVVLNSNGCKSDTAFYTVFEEEKLIGPTISCGVTSPSSVEFSWNTDIYHNGFEISIDSGANWISPSSGATGNTHEISGLNPQQEVAIWVRAFDNPPCNVSEISKATCTSDTCLSFDVSLQFNSLVCLGDTVQVTVSGLSNASYSLNFENNGAFTDTIFSFSPNITKWYRLEILDSNNLVCPATVFSLPIQVDEMPKINLMADKDLAVYCKGDSAEFTANDSISSFDWYYNDNLVQSGSNNTYGKVAVTAGDSVYVIAMEGVCVDTSRLIYLTELPVPNADFTFSRDASVYSFTPVDNTHASYDWDFGDGSTSTDMNPTHDFANKEGETVDVSLRVTTDKSCVADSVQQIDLPNFSSIEQLNALGIQLYPNPVQDQLTVMNKAENSIASISDIMGKQLLEMEVVNGITQIDLSHLKTGVYQISFVFDNKTVTHKFFKN